MCSYPPILKFLHDIWGGFKTTSHDDKTRHKSILVRSIHADMQHRSIDPKNAHNVHSPEAAMSDEKCGEKYTFAAMFV